MFQRQYNELLEQSWKARQVQEQCPEEQIDLLENTSGAASRLSKAVALQQQLNRKVRTLLRAVEHDELSKVDLLSRLKDVEEQTLGLGAVFSDTLAPTIFASVLPSGSTFSAMKVFSIQELLEHIVTYLSVTDFLSFEQINKEVQGAVMKSAHLNRYFNFSPSDEPGPWVLGTIGNFCPIDIHYCEDTRNSCFEEVCCEKKSYTHEDGLMVHAVFRGPVEILPIMGERGMSTLISQPPITKMIVGSYDDPNEPDETVVENENGLTLGKVSRAALSWADALGYSDGVAWTIHFRIPQEYDQMLWLQAREEMRRLEEG